METIASERINEFELLLNQQQTINLITNHLNNLDEKIKENLISFLTKLIENSEPLATIMLQNLIPYRIIKMLNADSNNNSFLNSITSFIFGFFNRLGKKEISEETYFDIFNRISSLLQKKNFVPSIMFDVFNLLRILQSILDLGFFERLMLNSNVIHNFLNENYFLDSFVLESFLIVFANISFKSSILTEVIKKLNN